MAYSTIDNLKPILNEQTLIELSKDDPPFVDITDEQCVLNIASAIEQADREIDAYLVRRMSVPLSPVPGLIVGLSAKIAIHKLHVRKHIYSEVWEREYERCLAILQKIYDGEMGLGAENGDSETVTDTSARIKTSTRERQFTSSLWSTYR